MFVKAHTAHGKRSGDSRPLLIDHHDLFRTGSGRRAKHKFLMNSHMAMQKSTKMFGCGPMSTPGLAIVGQLKPCKDSNKEVCPDCKAEQELQEE